MGNKAVFIDRDGVVNKNLFDESSGIKSPSKPSEFVFLPRAIKAIKILKGMGLKVVVISNQSGVATGHIDAAMLDKITEKIRSKIDVDGVYYCKHHPRFDNCSCRKPKDGLLKRAARDLGIDIKKSYMVGDNLIDIESGKKCKKKFLVGINFSTIKQIKKIKIKADYYLHDLYDAVQVIKKLEAD